MTTTYRTAGAWGAGKGSDLTPTEVDTNFYDKETRITDIEAAGVAVGISSITVSGNQMTVHMTDASTQGPFTLPAVEWNCVGAWQPSTLYPINSVVTAMGNAYLVLETHTSDTTFDPDATNGTAQPLYQFIIGTAATTKTRTGTTFAPILEDAGTYNRMTNTAGCVVTIPADATVNFPIDCEIHFRQCAETATAGGQVEITAESGVTLNGIEGFGGALGPYLTSAMGAVVTAKKIAADDWDLFGYFAAA